MNLVEKLDELLDESRDCYSSIQEEEYDALIPELAEHGKTLQHCINQIEKSEVTREHLDNLSKILEHHKKSIELINKRKQKISSKLVGLRNGRSLTLTYNTGS